jgi:hypothetical protein
MSESPEAKIKRLARKRKWNKQKYRKDIEKSRKYFRDWYHKNKEKNKGYTKKWLSENPGIRTGISLKFNLKRHYGMTVGEFDDMVRGQDNKCAICGNPPSINGRLYVDHNHETNSIRGLLCVKCNSGLGMFNDDIVLIKKSLKYLLKYKEKE